MSSKKQLVEENGAVLRLEDANPNTNDKITRKFSDSSPDGENRENKNNDEECDQARKIASMEQELRRVSNERDQMQMMLESQVALMREQLLKQGEGQATVGEGKNFYYLWLNNFLRKNAGCYL